MDEAAPRPRPPALLVALGVCAALLCAGLCALGVWQLHRLDWKQDLLARIERQLQSEPSALPGVSDWPRLTRDDEYRRVRLQGRWERGRDTLVLASTELGRGWWVLTPLALDGGGQVLVNRGFVPSELKGRVPPPVPGPELAGLLRWSEPGGSLLQANDPAGDRWFSRDVPAIAAARGLQGPVAPFFVDLQAPTGVAAGWPRPGLTVLRFANNHLAYALTWFALAAMVAAGYGFLLLHERHQRRLATVQARADHPLA